MMKYVGFAVRNEDGDLIDVVEIPMKVPAKQIAKRTAEVIGWIALFLAIVVYWWLVLKWLA